MIKWLVLNDGSDEIYNLNLVEGNSQKELLFDMIMMFGTSASTADVAKDILSKEIYDVSNLTIEQVTQLLKEHKSHVVGNRELNEDQFSAIDDILTNDLLTELQHLADNEYEE